MTRAERLDREEVLIERQKLPAQVNDRESCATYVTPLLLSEPQLIDVMRLM